MEPRTYRIDLQDYRTAGAKVFTTRPRGIAVRVASKIDTLASHYDHIVIRIPEDISSINPSFLEEFLENVVTRLGEKAFFQKFSFENQGRYKIGVDLQEAVERILRDESALA